MTVPTRLPDLLPLCNRESLVSASQGGSCAPQQALSFPGPRFPHLHNDKDVLWGYPTLFVAVMYSRNLEPFRISHFQKFTKPDHICRKRSSNFGAFIVFKVTLHPYGMSCEQDGSQVRPSQPSAWPEAPPAPTVPAGLRDPKTSRRRGCFSKTRKWKIAEG